MLQAAGAQRLMRGVSSPRVHEMNLYLDAVGMRVGLSIEACIWLVGIEVVLILGLVGVPTWFQRLSSRSYDIARCIKCGYGIRGIMTLTCPECGSDLREVGIKPPSRKGDPPRPVHPLIVIPLLPIPALILTVIVAESVLPRYYSNPSLRGFYFHPWWFWPAASLGWIAVGYFVWRLFQRSEVSLRAVTQLVLAIGVIWLSAIALSVGVEELLGPQHRTIEQWAMAGIILCAVVATGVTWKRWGGRKQMGHAQ
jgi:hypothetical protein